MSAAPPPRGFDAGDASKYASNSGLTFWFLPLFDTGLSNELLRLLASPIFTPLSPEYSSSSAFSTPSLDRAKCRPPAASFTSNAAMGSSPSAAAPPLPTTGGGRGAAKVGLKILRFCAIAARSSASASATAAAVAAASLREREGLPCCCSECIWCLVDDSRTASCTPAMSSSRVEAEALPNDLERRIGDSLDRFDGEEEEDDKESPAAGMSLEEACLCFKNSSCWPRLFGRSSSASSDKSSSCCAGTGSSCASRRKLVLRLTDLLLPALLGPLRRIPRVLPPVFPSGEALLFIVL
mmetsp:Transcript_31231/g.52226  ORF Transcript_31231/g.52226 Transcript_31231/m.52226 type:complete len:295 (-) Transcript_31231:445-1329(-)